jgi:nitrous oxide reductase accessory protein NosL
MKKSLVLILVLVLGVVFAGCAKKEEKKGTYLIKINNVSITKEDLDKEIEALPPFARKMFEGEEGVSKIIDELIKKELLYQEAKKKGIDKDPAYQKKIVDSQKLILISLLLEKEIEDKAKVSDSEVKAFYDKNKADFTVQGKTVEFDEIKDMLVQRLTAQKQKEVFDSYVEGLKKSYTIDINEEALSALTKKEGTPKEEPKKETPKK